jgi:hypothetical protein
MPMQERGLPESIFDVDVFQRHDPRIRVVFYLSGQESFVKE